MEGSLRQAGTKLRLAVQLADAASGAHLWAENLRARLHPTRPPFALKTIWFPESSQPSPTSAVFCLAASAKTLRSKNEDALTPHEAVLRSFSFLERISPTEHATVRRILERAVREAPDQADAWAMLAIMYDTEFADEFNLRPDPLDRAMAAAQRAVDLAPTHALGYYALAFTYFFARR